MGRPWDWFLKPTSTLLRKGKQKPFFLKIFLWFSLSNSSLLHPLLQASFLKAVPVSLASLSYVAPPPPMLCCSLMTSYRVAAPEAGSVQGYAQRHVIKACGQLAPLALSARVPSPLPVLPVSVQLCLGLFMHRVKDSPAFAAPLDSIPETFLLCSMEPNTEGCGVCTLYTGWVKSLWWRWSGLLAIRNAQGQEWRKM